MVHRPGVMAMAAATMLCAACVTINIYFPAAAAEKAADRIIDEVWQLKRDAEKTPPQAPAQPDNAK